MTRATSIARKAWPAKYAQQALTKVFTSAALFRVATTAYFSRAYRHKMKPTKSKISAITQPLFAAQKPRVSGQV
jgi:hypothetical protein